MVEFKPPQKGQSPYMSKFIRLGNEVFVTNPNDMSTTHEELAEDDDILEKVRTMREQNPIEVDAGVMGFKWDSISLTSESMTLQLPVSEVKKEARVRSVDVVASKSKDFSVSSS